MWEAKALCGKGNWKSPKLDCKETTLFKSCPTVSTTCKPVNKRNLEFLTQIYWVSKASEKCMLMGGQVILAHSKVWEAPS